MFPDWKAQKVIKVLQELASVHFPTVDLAKNLVESIHELLCILCSRGTLPASDGLCLKVRASENLPRPRLPVKVVE